MELIFERSHVGRGCSVLPACDVPAYDVPESLCRKSAPMLPEIAEVDLGRHYTQLAKQTHGVNDGFYPLGSCTMKYNPRVNEEMAALPGFTKIHPLQPVETAQGCLEVLARAESTLSEITGMDRVTLQPAAGAHGEYTGLLLIRAYHLSGAIRPEPRLLFLTLPTVRTPPARLCVDIPWSAFRRMQTAAWIWTACVQRWDRILPALC